MNSASFDLTYSKNPILKKKNLKIQVDFYFSSLAPTSLYRVLEPINEKNTTKIL
jgi:hypothetical protein